MASLVYNANKFLEIKKTYVLKDQDIDKLFSSIFNLKKKPILNKIFRLKIRKRMN